MSSPSTKTTNGVTLTKYIEEEEYTHTALVYEFVSSHWVPVDIELEEPIPGDLEPKHIGFHPAFQSDNWNIGDDTIQFESEIEPEATNTTVLAVMPDAPGSVREFLDAPAEFSVDAPDIENLASITGSFTRSPSANGSEESRQATHPPSPTQMGTEVDEEIPATNADSSAREESDQDELDTLVVAEQSQFEDDGENEIDVVGRLVSAIEAGAISEDDRQILREELGGTKSSVDARIEHLQSEFADLRAYIDALEEFIDENGDGGEIIKRFEQGLDSLEADLQSLDDRVDGFVPRVSAIEDNVEDHGQELDSVSSEVSRVDEELSDLRSELATLEQEVRNDDLEMRMAEIEDELADVSDFIQRLKETIQ